MLMKWSQVSPSGKYTKSNSYQPDYSDLLGSKSPPNHPQLILFSKIVVAWFAMRLILQKSH